VIPAAFDYKRATSAAEAIALVGEHGDEAKFLAGGHSLIPLMKLRLAQPSVLVDIGRLSDLSYITDKGDHVAIGALTRHMRLENCELLKKELPRLAHAASHVGDAQVRHRGTIGGSIAHADSASDLPATTLALGATYVAHGPKGERLIAAKDFYKGFLAQDERRWVELPEVQPSGPGLGHRRRRRVARTERLRCGSRQHGTDAGVGHQREHGSGRWRIHRRCGGSRRGRGGTVEGQQRQRRVPHASRQGARAARARRVVQVIPGVVAGLSRW